MGKGVPCKSVTVWNPTTCRDPVRHSSYRTWGSRLPRNGGPVLGRLEPVGRVGVTVPLPDTDTLVVGVTPSPGSGTETSGLTDDVGGRLPGQRREGGVGPIRATRQPCRGLPVLPPDSPYPYRPPVSSVEDYNHR